MAIIIRKKPKTAPPEAIIAEAVEADASVPDKTSTCKTLPTTAPVMIEAIKPQTLADVIDHLTQNNTLPVRRKRDLISACNNVARFLGRPPNDLPADVPALRDLIASLHHVQAGTTKKRLSNIRADLAAALEVPGIIPPTDRASVPSPAWQAFLGRATKKHHAIFLSRFARYCTYHQIDPDAVTDGIVAEFRTWLDLRILTNDPMKIVKNTVTAFNAIIKRANLDMPLLTTALSPRYLARRLDTYPETLADDIERYLERLRKPDLFSDDGPRRALRPMSLRNTEAHIRQTLDAAVEAGYEPSHFRSLADLIDINVIRAAIEHMIARRDGKMPSALSNILATLLAIARYYVDASPEVVNKLKQAKSTVRDKLGTNRPTMSDKTQRRMDQFEDRENIFRLVELPAILMKRADKNGDKKSAAFDAMIAAALAILLSVPLRIKNLSSLHMKEDITLTKEGRDVVILIHLDPSQTKGRQAIDAAIRPPYSTMIFRFINTYRKHFADKGSDWLFPAPTGDGPRTPDHFGRLIKSKIFRETGLTANAHLFRSFSALIYLEAHPGNYEDVRRVVGHAKVETTTSFYAPTSSKAAFRRYGDVLRNLTNRKPRK